MYNGHCRLGLGNQQHVLAPNLVPQVVGLQLPAHSLAVMYLAGPNDVTMGVFVADGGMTHWLITPDDDGPQDCHLGRNAANGKERVSSHLDVPDPYSIPRQALSWA